MCQRSPNSVTSVRRCIKLPACHSTSRKHGAIRLPPIRRRASNAACSICWGESTIASSAVIASTWKLKAWFTRPSTAVTGAACSPGSNITFCVVKRFRVPRGRTTFHIQLICRSRIPAAVGPLPPDIRFPSYSIVLPSTLSNRSASACENGIGGRILSTL